jgi:hypothetical protein
MTPAVPRAHSAGLACSIGLVPAGQSRKSGGQVRLWPCALLARVRRPGRGLTMDKTVAKVSVVSDAAGEKRRVRRRACQPIHRSGCPVHGSRRMRPWAS